MNVVITGAAGGLGRALSCECARRGYRLFLTDVNGPGLSCICEGIRRQFDAAVETILAARRIYIVGMRSSTALADFMGFYMNFLLDNVRTIHDNVANEIYEQIMRIGEGDVFIALSFPRYSSRTVKAMKFAKSKGATAIGITDNDTSPFHGVADICLYAKSDMVSFVDSLVAPLSLINALIVSVGMHSREGISNTFATLEQLWKDYDVFAGVEG